MKNILLIGGAGYVGNVLVPRLLNDGYKVRVYDLLFFGHGTLPLKNPNLEVIEGDIRDTEHFVEACNGIDVVLYLGNLNNYTTNYEEIAKIAKESGVKSFIYHSSDSIANTTSPQVRAAALFSSGINGYSPRTRLSSTELIETKSNSKPKPSIG